MTAAEQLKQNVDTLPEPLAREVLDYLLMIAKRHGLETPIAGHATLRGRLKRYADPNQRELEKDAWIGTLMEKHASD
jgi:hypothetical protein